VGIEDQWLYKLRHAVSFEHLIELRTQLARLPNFHGIPKFLWKLADEIVETSEEFLSNHSVALKLEHERASMRLESRVTIGCQHELV
jgi:hypothetical protein